MSSSSILNSPCKFSEKPYPLSSSSSSEISAKVIVKGLFWRCVEIESAIKHVAEENNYTFVCLEDLGDDCKNMAIGQYWHEGVSAHPSDEGMRKIAERIVEKI